MSSLLRATRFAAAALIIMLLGAAIGPACVALIADARIGAAPIAIAHGASVFAAGGSAPVDLNGVAIEGVALPASRR